MPYRRFSSGLVRQEEVAMILSEIDHISLEVITCHVIERVRARERARGIYRETHRQNSSTHTNVKAYVDEDVCINVRRTHADLLYCDGQDTS